MAPYLLLALLSGIPALVYEVIWTREVALVLGSQIEGISAVLAAFFGGLALGARWFGVRADRVRSPLRLYAVLEAGAGLLALLSLFLLRTIAREGASVPDWGLLGLGMLAIVPVTFLLGGTLPALLRGAAPDALSVSRAAGTLVAANTVGALLGVGLAAWSAPRIGLATSLQGAAAGGIALAAVAAWLARSQARTAPAPQPPGPGPVPVAPVVLVAAALAGAATLAFEALAARAAALRLGSSLFAWAWVLGLVLAGLAVGNAVCARPASRSREPARHLGWIEAAAALVLALGVIGLRSSPATAAAGLSVRTLLLVAVALLPPVFLMGGAFPFFVRLAVRSEANLGAAFGGVSAANTAGGIAGALLAPFVLLPWLGLDAALLGCAGVNMLLGAGFLASAGGGGGWGGWLGAGAAVAPTALVAGLTLTAPPVPPDAGRLLFVHHGRQATAAVVRDRGRRDLYVDGDPEASTGGSARRTEQLLAVVPLMLHPAPRRFLEVGLGSGITLGTAARFPLERIDCVEISEAVLRAARYFEPDNGHVTSGGDARVRIVRGDGRAFLARNPGRYDVVVANTLHPWSVGATGLYSREYFERVAGALRRGGLAVQWLPLDRIGADDLAAILRTFFAVFREGAVYWGADNLLVVGAHDWLPSPPATPPPAMRALLTEMDLADHLPLQALRVASAQTVRTALGPEPLLSDDVPRLEARFSRHRASPLARDEIGLVERLAEADSAEVPRGLRLWLDSLVARRAGDDARADRLERLAEAAGFALARRARADRVAAGGRAELAARRLAEAETAFRAALQAWPGHREALLGMALVAHARRDPVGAGQGIERLLAAHPRDAEGWNKLADLLYAAGRASAARRALEEALRWDPFFPEALANAGLLAAQAGDRPTAHRMLEQLAAISPAADLAEERALRQALDSMP